LKCDLRDDRHVREKLARYNRQPVQYEEGLEVARRIRASRYLGRHCSPSGTLTGSQLVPCSECSAKHNRGVNEVFLEATRVSIGSRPKGGNREDDGGGCVIA
jgi:Rho family, other